MIITVCVKINILFTIAVLIQKVLIIEYKKRVISIIMLVLSLFDTGERNAAGATDSGHVINLPHDVASF